MVSLKKNPYKSPKIRTKTDLKKKKSVLVQTSENNDCGGYRYYRIRQGIDTIELVSIFLPSLHLTAPSLEKSKSWP